MKALFLHISDTLAGIVRWIDFDLGQLDQETPPISYPAVLVAFDAPQFLNLSAGAQQADTIITLRIAFKVWERTHSKAQESFREVGLAHLDTLASIHAALSGSNADTFSPLVRISMTNEQRADLRVYTLQYSTMLYDCPAPVYTAWPDTVDDDEGNPVPIDPPALCVQTDIVT